MLRRRLLKPMGSGLLVVLPLGLAYLILKFLFDAIDGVLQPGIRAVFGHHIPGLGLVGLAIAIYLAGLLTMNWVGRALIELAKRALLKIPFVGSVYGSARQLVESFSGTGETGFKRVVMIEYPRKESWTIGFLTGTTADHLGEQLAIVYVPTAPTPNSGWVALIPVGQVRDTDLTVQVALKMVLSGGISSPPTITWSSVI